MNTFIALFRAINVGGKNILPMQNLRDLLESMGCTGVKTYIQSGNVVFQTPQTSKNRLVNEIKALIKKNHDFEPGVLLLEAKDIQLALKHNPYPSQSGKTVHFYFLDSHPKHPDMDKLKTLQTNTEKFELKDKTFYLYAPDGIGRSKLATGAEKALGVPATARNRNTVEKLLSLTD